MGFLVYVGVWYVRTNAATRTPALSLPLSYAVYTALPAAMLLGIYFALRRAWKSLRGKDVEHHERTHGWPEEERLAHLPPDEDDD
jgi:TRAP-type C4-dicarboxylate transport system permease small subunit